MKDSIRSPKGQFKKGLSGNLAGRPMGSRNKTTLACEQLLEGQSEQLTAKLLEMALEGNIQAMRMCVDRTVPVRKERSINLKLHPVAQLRDVATQLKEIVSAVADGTITPGEGESVSRILASHAQVIEATKRVPSDEEMIAKAQLTKEYYDSIDPDIVMRKRMDDTLVQDRFWLSAFWTGKSVVSPVATAPSPRGRLTESRFDCSPTYLCRLPVCPAFWTGS